MPFCAREPLIAILLLALLALPAAADEPIEATLARLDREIATRPEDGALWARRAGALRLAARYDAALHAIERAEQLGLAPPRAEHERGVTLLAAGRVAEAESALRRARDAAPDDTGVLLAHARALARLGRFRDAAESYDRIVARMPRSSPDVHLERARARSAGDGGSIDSGLAALAEANFALGPVPALEQAGLELELRAGRFDAALARLDRMSQGSQQHNGLLIQRAQILERAGRLAEARNGYRSALVAIGELPPVRRATPAARGLARDASAGLARLAESAGESQP